MTVAPKTPKDLTLAPVAAQIDRNLQMLRDKTDKAIEWELALALNVDDGGETPERRARHVLEYALKFVDLHGWAADVTPDRSAIRLTGGSVSIDLALGAGVEGYIRAPQLAAA